MDVLTAVAKTLRAVVLPKDTEEALRTFSTPGLRKLQECLLSLPNDLKEEIVEAALIERHWAVIYDPDKGAPHIAAGQLDDLTVRILTETMYKLVEAERAVLAPTE